MEVLFPKSIFFLAEIPLEHALHCSISRHAYRAVRSTRGHFWMEGWTATGGDQINPLLCLWGGVRMPALAARAVGGQAGGVTDITICWQLILLTRWQLASSSNSYREKNNRSFPCHCELLQYKRSDPGWRHPASFSADARPPPSSSSPRHDGDGSRSHAHTASHGMLFDLFLGRQTHTKLVIILARDR